jgi:hypothetical protein
VDDVDEADTIDAIVRAVPGVADLHAGMYGEVGTYLPGRRVVGIRVGAHAIEVHITARADRPVHDTAAAVRAAIAARWPDVTVDVTVEGVVLPPLDDND